MAATTVVLVMLVSKIFLIEDYSLHLNIVAYDAYKIT